MPMSEFSKSSREFVGLALFANQGKHILNSCYLPLVYLSSGLRLGVEVALNIAPATIEFELENASSTSRLCAYVC